MSERSAFTITPDDLGDKLGKDDLSLVDASWYLPAQNRDARAEFAQARIPGAVFFDIDTISDQDTNLPHMLPSADSFARAAGELGISSNDEIVVYDGPGLFSAARVWWMFRVMGCEKVCILDGGFDRWKIDGRPVETTPPVKPKAVRFEARIDKSRVASIEDIKANLKLGQSLILDARAFDRFAGKAPEPRAGLRSGHVPGSHSLPFDRLVEAGKLKDIDELQKILREFPIEGSQEVITSCGSGVTAAVLTLALESTGHTANRLYDGSWAEWGQAENAPVAQWPGKTG